MKRFLSVAAQAAGAAWGGVLCLLTDNLVLINFMQSFGFRVINTMCLQMSTVSRHHMLL